MHASSLENMHKCYVRYIWGDWSKSRGPIRVLDIGGADVNGSYRDVFSEPGFDYVAADIEAGPGVHLVLEDPYHLPHDDESQDIIVSGQALEHVEFFWLSFQEMCRVLKPDGYIFLIAPSAGPIHRYPVDCYRFYPDAYAALAKYGEALLVDCWLDDRGPWKDLVGVFSKAPSAEPSLERLRRAALAPEMNDYSREWAPAPVTVSPRDPLREAVRGERSYLEALELIHETLAPRLYLEIGVRRGNSLALASCPSLAVDPAPEPNVAIGAEVQMFEETSDFFFEFRANEALAGGTFDLALIDGMHRFEFALRDFMNLEKLAKTTSVIVIDDIYPNHPAQALPHRETQVWTGDVWKLYHCLKHHRPDLQLFPLNAEPTGLLVITNLNPNDRSLWQQYNPLVRAYREADVRASEQLIVSRHEAVPTTDAEMLDSLRRMRQSRIPAFDGSS